MASKIIKNIARYSFREYHNIYKIYILGMAIGIKILS